MTRRALLATLILKPFASSTGPISDPFVPVAIVRFEDIARLETVRGLDATTDVTLPQYGDPVLPFEISTNPDVPVVPLAAKGTAFIVTCVLFAINFALTLADVDCTSSKT
jgi:hypothetical protein